MASQQELQHEFLVLIMSTSIIKTIMTVVYTKLENILKIAQMMDKKKLCCKGMTRPFFIVKEPSKKYLR